MKRRAWVVAAAGTLLAAVVQSQPAEQLFRGADMALGQQLIKQHRCVECHTQKFGGDGTTSIYRPAGRINTPGFLRGMVEQCNTELNLRMRPSTASA